MNPSPVKVLIVDDSPVCRELLAHIYHADPGLQVIGTANNGEEALAALNHLRPDVISMDIQMPKMNGFEATRIIMETRPIPIVIVTSSFSRDEVASSFRAMQMGALTVENKPKGPGHPDYAAEASHLTKTLKAMSEVKLVRRRPQRTTDAPPPAAAPSIRPRVVVIGASTGGPPVLQTILASLPRNFPAPVAIVQHIATGFIASLGEWLEQTTGWPVHLASHGEKPLAGHAYLAPDGSHLGFDHAGRFLLSTDEQENGLRPAVGFLFRTTAAAFGGAAIGVILSGMGCDGAAELKRMKDCGAATIAQDKESSVVHGMPGQAIALGAADQVLPPAHIATALLSLTGTSS